MDDLISRHAAIDALRTCYDTETVTMDNGDEYINYGDAIGEIEQLPSAQPERKTGKWIVIDDGCISGKCSVCGWAAHMYEDDVMGMDYCPNCGARLEDEE